MPPPRRLTIKSYCYIRVRCYSRLKQLVHRYTSYLGRRTMTASSVAQCRASRRAWPARQALDRACAARRRPAHAHTRRDRGERGAARHRRRAAAEQGRPALGDDRVHALLRRPDAARRQARRPVRATAAHPGRPGRLHRRVAPVRPRRRPGVAAGRPGPAGDGCRAALARRARHRADDVHRRRPDQGPRRVVRPGRPRLRARRDSRRRPHHGGGLALDLHCQRADRDRAADRGAPGGAVGPCRA